MVTLTIITLATDSDFQIPKTLHPNVVNLRYFKKEFFYIR